MPRMKRGDVIRLSSEARLNFLRENPLEHFHKRETAAEVRDLAFRQWTVRSVSKNGMLYIEPDTHFGFYKLAYGRWIRPSKVKKIGESDPETPIILASEIPEEEGKEGRPFPLRFHKETFKARRPIVRVRQYWRHR